MISVSPAYALAVKDSPRQWIPRVEITWSDPFIDPSIVVSSTDVNRIDRTAQVADIKIVSERKWAHLTDTLKADGTYYPMPDTDAGAQMGWYGADRGDLEGDFAAPQVLEITFDARPALGLSVVGDSEYNEYPVDFEITIYDIDDNLLHTETVTDNALLNWSVSISQYYINSAVKMVLSITKWSIPERVVKITEFYTSVIETYTGDEIISMELLEEREIADGSLPVGNISANELDLTLQNIRITANGIEINEPFAYENSASVYTNVLKNNRKIRAWVGLVLPDTSVEWIPLGVFWSGDWKASEMSGEVSTSGRDRMEKLRKAQFIESELLTGTNLYFLAEQVLESARDNIPMADLMYEIDLELQKFSVPFGYFPRQDYFKCLKQIAEACQGQAYMTRGDVLTITGPSFVGNE